MPDRGSHLCLGSSSWGFRRDVCVSYRSGHIGLARHPPLPAWGGGMVSQFGVMVSVLVMNPFLTWPA